MKKTCVLYFKLQFQHNAMRGLKAILQQNRVLLAIFIKPDPIFYMVRKQILSQFNKILKQIFKILIKIKK
jgi:hypothetical protein